LDVANAGYPIATSLNIPLIICLYLHNFAELGLAQADYGLALEKFQQGYEQASAIGLKEWQGLMGYGLARTYLAQAQPEQALAFGRASLAILQAIGHRRTNEVQAWVAQLTPL